MEPLKVQKALFFHCTIEYLLSVDKKKKKSDECIRDAWQMTKDF